MLLPIPGRDLLPCCKPDPVDTITSMSETPGPVVSPRDAAAVMDGPVSIVGSSVSLERDEQFSMTMCLEEDAVHLRVSGDLDLVTSAEFIRCTEPLLSLRSLLVIDMSDAGFVDSEGLEALLELNQAGVACHREVVIQSPNPQLRRLLELTQTATLLKVNPSTP